MKPIQRICQSTILVLLVALASAVSAQTMKIAVPAVDSDKSSLISEETGRAPFFLLFNNTGHFLEAISNPAINQSGGISRTVVALLADNDITLVVGTSIGDKMKLALTKHQIEFISKTGSADVAVKKITQK